MDLSLIFLIAAIVVFIIAAIGVTWDRVNLLAVGLALFAASFLPL